MVSCFVVLLITCISLVSAHRIPWEGPFSILDSDDEGFNFKAFLPPPPEIQDDSWSEVMVIKMHYDCEGLLVRQEVSKLKTRTRVGRMPEAEGHKSFVGGYSEGGRAPEPEVTFRSMRERFKIPRTTERPVEETTSRLELVFEPDRIIDSPVIPCPKGQNEDLLGNCRPVFPESTQN